MLAALFDKGEGIIDEVLDKVEYSGSNLHSLTYYRRELADSPEKFFRVLDKIEKPILQERAVCLGVSNLFKAGKHDLVVPLVNALGKRTFKSNILKDEAIWMAFRGGARRGNRDIVKLYCKHPAVTSEEYTIGLSWSWNDDKPNQVFRFLVERADQGDLAIAKGKYAYWRYPEYRLTIDEAFKSAPPIGSRHRRPIEVAEVRIAMSIFEALGYGLAPDTVDIIRGYAATDDTINGHEGA